MTGNAMEYIKKRKEEEEETGNAMETTRTWLI